MGLCLAPYCFPFTVTLEIANPSLFQYKMSLKVEAVSDTR